MIKIKQKIVSINNINFSNDSRFVLIAGPCAIESLDHAVNMTGLIKEICKKFKINFVYKSSFDKANRTSINSERGIGFRKISKYFSRIKKSYKCSIITDVHEASQCNKFQSLLIFCKYQPFYLDKQIYLYLLLILKKL